MQSSMCQEILLISYLVMVVLNEYPCTKLQLPNYMKLLKDKTFVVYHSTAVDTTEYSLLIDTSHLNYNLTVACVTI